MSRLHRLYRSAIVCFAIVVALLLFTVPASREFVAGNPMWLVTLSVLAMVFCLIALAFLWVADKVEARDREHATA